VTVTLTKGSMSKKVTGTLKSGKVTVTLPKLSKGTWKVGATYAGSASYTSSKGSVVSLKVK